MRIKDSVAYRARASVHRGLVELLPHSEGDVGGAHRGGRLDRQRLTVLRDLHQGVGRRLHGNHAQHHVDACEEDEEDSRQQTVRRWVL